MAQVQDLLAAEKIENENNLLALKKVLANNINFALDHKAVYTNGSASQKDKHLTSSGSHPRNNQTRHSKETRETQVIKQVLSDSYLPQEGKERLSKSSKRKPRYDNSAENNNGLSYNNIYPGPKKSAKQGKIPGHPQMNNIASSDEDDHDFEDEVTSNHSYDSANEVGSFDEDDEYRDYEQSKNGGHHLHHHQHHHNYQQQQPRHQHHHSIHNSQHHHQRDLSQNQSPNHYYQSSNQRSQQQLQQNQAQPGGFYPSDGHHLQHSQNQ